MIELNSTFLINFENILITLQEKLSAFVNFLDEEKLLLNKQDLAALEISTQQKQRYIHDVQTCMDALKACLNSQSFEEKNIQAVIDLYPPEKRTTVLALWNDIKVALEQCDQKNLLNGILISTMKNLNDVLLRIITQRPEEATYSNQSNNNHKDTISTREHKA
jgi:flagellar biosynthesis/type III secretory pathway chaperone